MVFENALPKWPRPRSHSSTSKHIFSYLDECERDLVNLGERFQKSSFSVVENAVQVWTEGQAGEKKNK